MPSRLRPTASVAADAILVGDPGRALMLAQALLEQPKMSNHARGLWGYWGRTARGEELTVQSTGMGGPSAALVLADLAKLGVRRAIRVGTCVATRPESGTGDLLTVLEAHAWAGGGAGAAVFPDPDLTARLRQELGPATRPAIVASLDALHRGGAERAPYAERVDAADMQTATPLKTLRERAQLLRRAAQRIPGATVDVESPREAYWQTLLSRGDRRLAPLLIAVHENDGAFWPVIQQAVRAGGLEGCPSPDDFVLRRYAPDETLPWDFIDHAVDKRYLLSEWRKALLERQTAPCDVATCETCGAC